MKRLGFLLLLLLTACTGSQEPPLPALLAAGGEDGVRFYRAQDLQRGTGTPVETWTTPGLQDLAYSPTFQRLYLLFPDRVEAYDASGFTEASAPRGTPADQGLPPGVDCTGGYLRLGQGALLLHCPAVARAFLWPLDGSGNLEEADLTGLDPAARLALLPQGSLDLLAYLTRSALGYRPAQDPQGTPSLEKPLSPPLDADPFDLRIDAARGRLLGLGRAGLKAYLYTLRGEALGSQEVLGDFFGTPRLALDPVAGLAVYGRGFQVLEPRASSVQEAYTDFAAGAVGQDGYLYLASGSLLYVYDLVPSPPQRVATPSLGFAPKALAFLPVE
ncbi:hypothetical protein TTMY_1052 [Thermus thermophilus]|uniref:hypothetical protein n=1 Tax=Thermus thermophilus TaxID=274 RepID=UPI00090BFD40|nr:hypothetical protein [Thermus thermophilus]BAW01452.1 hypothetical protein TTMY_1052 [Thermus thermophilus]BDB12085.1 hypothetical protein TthTMY_18240 [Thermus thermophilus]